jgi:carbamoyl-phosphate synthase large subunit
MVILFLSVGRRVELLRFARETLHKNNLPARIVACDMNPTAPALYFADKGYTVPPIDETVYIDEIIRIAKMENADIIIPTLDTELLPLAKRSHEIIEKTGALFNISSEQAVRICRDKTESARFFVAHGFDCPKEYEPGGVTFPAFIKPRHGSSSIDAVKITSRDELDFYLNRVKNPMLQEFVSGDEYTVDAFSDFEGNPVTIVPRKRLAVRSGEILKGHIIRDREVIEPCRRLVKALGLCGHNTLQCIKSGGRVCFIEVNPRFGGGAPMSLRAGADSIMNLVRLRNGEALAYNENWLNDVTCTRFDDSVFINKDGELMDI